MTWKGISAEPVVFAASVPESSKLGGRLPFSNSLKSLHSSPCQTILHRKRARAPPYDVRGAGRVGGVF